MEYRVTKGASSAAGQPSQIIALGFNNMLVFCTTNHLSNLFLTIKWVFLHYCEPIGMQIQVQRLPDMHVFLSSMKPDFYTHLILHFTTGFLNELKLST